VKIELHGPEYSDTPQKAIIDLTCDKTVEVGPIAAKGLMC